MNTKVKLYLLALALILTVYGCGQTGPLYLPQPESPEQAEST